MNELKWMKWMKEVKRMKQMTKNHVHILEREYNNNWQYENVDSKTIKEYAESLSEVIAWTGEGL